LAKIELAVHKRESLGRQAKYKALLEGYSGLLPSNPEEKN